jgi:hypothetical protein
VDCKGAMGTGQLRREKKGVKNAWSRRIGNEGVGREMLHFRRVFAACAPVVRRGLDGGWPGDRRVASGSRRTSAGLERCGG